MEIFKKFRLIIVAGLIIRILISAITYHPDVKAPTAVSFMYLSGQFNPYEYSKVLKTGDDIDDLPLSYFLALPIHFVGHLMVDKSIEQTFLYNPSQLFGNPSLFSYLLYAKSPQLLFDVLTGIILALLGKDLVTRKKLLLLWMFNPLDLWASAAIGQIDIYPTFFIVLTTYLISRNRLNLAAMSLGMGGAIKSAPFLLLPLLLGFGKSIYEKILLLALAMVPYLVSVLFYLPSADFRRDALFASQLGKILFSQIKLSGGESIFIVPTLLIIVYLLYLVKKRSVNDFITFGTVILLITLSFTHFHIQWLLWVVPFIFLLTDKFHLISQLAILGIIVSTVLMLFLFDASLTLRLFSPAFPQLKSIMGFWELLSSDQIFFFRSLAASIFAASSGLLIWNLFKVER